MAESLSSKSKVQFQLNPRSDLRTEIATIAKSRQSDDKKWTDEIKRKILESKETDNRENPIDFVDRSNIDEYRVDRLSMVLDQQFSSSQSDPSSDFGLWNQEGQEGNDRIKDRVDRSWIVEKCQVSGSMAKNHSDFSGKSKDMKIQADKNHNAEIVQDTKKVINRSSSKSGSGIDEMTLIDNNQSTDCYGKNNSERRRGASKNTEADLPVTMKTLMDEFNDLTKKMSSLKRTLTDLNNCSVNFKTRHSKSYSTDDISMIVDDSDAKKVIADCIAELAAIKNYLDGNEKISSEFRDALYEIKFTDCCTERLPHVHGELKKKPTVLTFDTGLSLVGERDVNFGRKKFNSYVSSQENPDSPGNVDHYGRKCNSRNEIVASRLELSKRNIGSGNVSFVRKETAVSPVTSGIRDEEKIDEVRKASSIVEKDVVAFSNANDKIDTRKKSKRRKWYSCFLDCTGELEDRDFVDSSQDESNEHVDKERKYDKQTKFEEESIPRESYMKKVKDQEAPSDVEEKSKIEMSVDKKLNSSNVVIPSEARIEEKTSGTNRKDESPLGILDNMDSLYDRYTPNQDRKNEKDTRVFQVYNALVNENINDFRKIYTSWLSQPVLNSTAVGLNVSSEFSKIRYTFGASVKNLRKSKSVGFSYFEKSYGTCIFGTKRKTEKSNIEEVTGVMETAKRPVRENLLKDIREFLHYYLKQRSSVNNSKFLQKQFEHYSPEIWNSARRISKERNSNIVETRSTIIDLNSKILRKNKNLENITKNNQLSASISNGSLDPEGWSKIMKYIHKYSSCHENDITGDAITKAKRKLAEKSCVLRRELKVIKHPISSPKTVLTSGVTRAVNEEENFKKEISKVRRATRSKIRLCKSAKIKLENKENYTNRTEQCETVWALARVNIFDDGFKTYEILQTTPLPPGRMVNISKVNAIRVGETCNCEK